MKELDNICVNEESFQAELRFENEMKLEKCKKTIKSLKENLEIKENTIGKVKEDLLLVSEQKDYLEGKYKAMYAKIEEANGKKEKEAARKQMKLNGKIEKLQYTINSLVNDKKAIEKENNEIKEQITDMENDMKQLVGVEELELAELRAKKLEDTISKLEKKGKGQAAEMEKLYEGIDECKQIISEQDNEIAFFSKENSTLTTITKELKSTVVKIEDDIREKASELQKGEQLFRELEEKNKNLTNEQSGIREDLTTALIEMETLQFLLGSEEGDNERCKVEVQQLRQEKYEMRKALKERGRQVDAYKKRFQLMEGDMRSLHAKMMNDKDAILLQKITQNILDSCYGHLQKQDTERSVDVKQTLNSFRNGENIIYEPRNQDRLRFEEEAQMAPSSKEIMQLRRRITQLEEELREAEINCQLISNRKCPKCSHLIDEAHIYQGNQLEVENWNLLEQVRSLTSECTQYEIENKELRNRLTHVQSQLMGQFQQEMTKCVNQDGNDPMQYKLMPNDEENETLMELRSLNNYLAEEVKMLKKQTIPGQVGTLFLIR